MKIKLIFSLLFITLLSCNKDDNPTTTADKPSEQKTINLTVDGNARSFIVYLPTGYNNAGKMPLIFAIHGGSGTPEGMINIANFKPISDREKVVLIYPAGIQNNWNDGRPTTPNQLGINDVSFFNQMCAVDAATIEATTIASSCNPGRPVPAIYIHGTTDPLVPFTGGQMTAGGTAGGTVLSHFQAVDKWITINGCTSTPVITDLPDIANDGTTIKQRVYSNSTNGSEVVSYVILNGGHTWPQGYQYLNEAIIGKTSQDMNACEVIWTFFKRFKRQ